MKWAEEGPTREKVPQAPVSGFSQSIMLGEEGFQPASASAGRAQGDVIWRGLHTSFTYEWSVIRGSVKMDEVLAFFDRSAFYSISMNHKRMGGSLVVDINQDGHESIAFIGFNDTSMAINAAVKSPAEGFKLLQYVLARFPVHRPEAKPTAPAIFVNFWMMGPGGPASSTRYLDSTTWASIEKNYAARTLEGLGKLMSPGYRPEKSGQLLLWHGDPGLGKTWAIRALAWEWKDWCTIHYIMDPNELLSGSPIYIQELLFSNSGPESRYLAGEPTVVGMNDDDDDDPTEKEREEANNKRLFGSNRWRLIVMEDTGELLDPDAKHRTGPGLARLLNSADGLLGQGSRVLFIITTNEPIEKIHPAVARPGRCAANIQFAKFTRKEAEEWLTKEGVTDFSEAKLKDGATLAELYAIAAKRNQIVSESKPKEAFGFAVGGRA